MGKQHADSTCDPRHSARFPMEFMKKLTRVGLPPHHLYVDKGMVLMLLRSLSPRQRLCNGARLILSKATNILLYCWIATGDYAREEALIPRIQIRRQDEQFIEWNRRQFPVMPAIALTIKKIYGQTLKEWDSG